MRRLLASSLTVLLTTGCLTAARTSYEVATDERAVEIQKADTQIALTIKKRYLESPVKGLGGLDVYCRYGKVVLAGIVEKGAPAGAEAVRIARAVDGVKTVDTYFVPSRTSLVDDFTIKQKIIARMVGDGELKAGQVDLSVLAGHVVFVGVVDGADKVQRILGHARSTDGVIAVKSFIQVP
jgi:osmotically-inducible protein OsmY